MSYRLIDVNNITFNSDGFITAKNIEKMPCIYADLPNGMDGEHYVLEQEDSSTNFKDELKTLVAKRLDEINHFISGCNSPFSYSQIREVQELMCDITTTLGIEVEE